MAQAADPYYDIQAALDTLAPGLIVTRDLLDAAAAQYAANGFTPLTQAQVIAIAGPLPPMPSGLPRFADSNPSPGDNWSIGQQTGGPLS